MTRPFGKYRSQRETAAALGVAESTICYHVRRYGNLDRVSAETIALVRLRQLAVPAGRGWLFPGDAADKDQPVQEVRRFWAGIQTAADLPGVRIHDLRHTFASLLVSGGASLEMIGRLLGHSQARTTMRYTHLMDSPLRAGVDAVASMMRPRPRLIHDSESAAVIPDSGGHARSG